MFAYPDGSPSKLIRIIGVPLYDYGVFVREFGFVLT